MHGIIFASFRQFIWTRLPDHADAIWDGTPYYSAADAYPDDDFTALVERASTVTGKRTRDILLELGRFTGFWAFRAMRGDYYAESGGTRRFLLDIESRIHETVRATTPGAAPPYLHVTPLGDDGVSISYTSARRLCDLLEGLVLGVGDYYGERFSIEQPMCMLRGDAACSFLVTPA